MTIQLDVLDTQLASGALTVRRLLSGEAQPGGLAVQALAALGTRLRQVLRGFDDIELERRMLAAKAASPQADQAHAAASHAAAFDTALLRVAQRSLRLSALLLAWHRRSTGASHHGLAHQVEHLALTHGHRLPAGLVRATTLRLTSQPEALLCGAGASAEASPIETAVVALGISAVLLAPPGSDA